MQSAASAFPIGRNYAVRRRFLSCSSRSYSFTLRSSLVFVSGLFGKLCSKLTIVEKGGDLTRTFHCIYMRQTPVPLISLQIAHGINDKSSRLKLVSSKPFTQIIETPSLESAEKPPQIRQILLRPQQVHCSRVASPQPLTALDCCSLSGIIGVIRFVRAPAPRGIFDCMGHGPFLCLAVEL